MTRPTRTPAHAEHQTLELGQAKLNVGCGQDYRVNWTNVDSWRGNGVVPDIQGSLLQLPVADNYADMVYAAHVLEHVAYQQVPQALRELARVTKPGGHLCVVIPDWLGLPATFDHPATDPTLFGTFHHPGDSHQWPASAPLVMYFMQRCGLRGAVEINTRTDKEFVALWQIRDADELWQSCIYWRKPTNNTNGGSTNSEAVR